MKRYALNCIALAIGCLAALGILEVGLRMANPFESRVRGDRIVLPAGRHHRFESGNLRGVDPTVVHTKNAIGFRGPDLPKGGLGDALSIIAIGGSTTECLFLSDGKDWPLLLLSFLNEAFFPVWLNNAGLDGHSTFGHTVLLTDYILRLKPRMVLFFIGINDVGREGVNEHAVSQIKGPLKLNSVEALAKSAAAHSEVAATILNLYRYARAKALGLPHHSVDIRALPHGEAVQPDLEKILQNHSERFVPLFEKRVRAMVRLARSSDIDPVLITQPLLYGDAVDPVTGVHLGTVKIPKKGTGYAAWRILELYNDATRRVGETENVLTIDLANHLEKNSDYFYDGLHYTNRGSYEAARIVYEQLKPYLLDHYGSFAIPGKGGGHD